MAMAACRDCGLQVSTAAASCPKCGRVFGAQVQRAETSDWKRAAFLMILVGIIVIAFARACSSSTPSTFDSGADARNIDAREIGEAEYATTQTLRDPSSAKFENVVVVRNAGSVAVCGYVNAKNGFGGYSGAARFMARNQTALVESAANTRDFSKTWNRACVPQ